MLYRSKYKKSYLILMLIISLYSFQNSIAQTSIWGKWTKAGSPYYVTADLEVPEDSTLIIEEGVEIEFWGPWSLRINGLLEARGTKENMIAFHGNGNTGKWKNIYFAESASPGCILNYCIIKDGGYEDSTNIFICNNDTSVTISNCEILNSTGDGISINSLLGTHGGSKITKKCNPKILRNKIYGNKKDGIKVNARYYNSYKGSWNDTSIASPIIKYNIIYNNKNRAIVCSTFAKGSRAPNQPGYWDCYIKVQSNPIVQQNTIYGSSMSNIFCDVIIEDSFWLNDCIFEANPYLSSNIISNSAKYGLDANNFVETTNVKFNCFWNNDSSNFKGINGDLGKLTGINANGDSCDKYYNIYFDPIFTNEANNDFRLTNASKCIDAGELSLPRNPDGSLPDIGAIYFDKRDLKPILSVYPMSIDFGEVTGKADTFVVVKNIGTADLHVTSIYVSDPDIFSIDTTNFAFTLVPGDSDSLVICFLPDKIGEFSATLIIKSDGGDSIVTLLGKLVPITEPDIVLSDTSLNFNNVFIDSSKSLILIIKNVGSDTLAVDNIYCKQPVFFPDITSGAILADDSIEVIITFRPDSVKTYSDTLFILSNDPSDPIAYVVLSGNGIILPVPDIKLSESYHDFGEVVIHDRENWTFSIINLGTDTLRIDKVTWSDSAFSVSEIDYFIQKNDRQEVSVTFCPAEARLYLDTLKISSNDLDNQISVVILMGKGIRVEPTDITVKPNPFTPNGDGFNDFVEFKYPEMYDKKPIIKIFNIRGRKVTELKDFSGNEYRWYGKDEEGKDLNPGIYIYILEVNGKKISKGTITLIQ